MNSLIVSENTNKSATVTNEIRLDLATPITFKNQQVALSLLTIYYSWANITTALGNNTFSYIYNSTTYPIVIDDGFYTIDDLNNYLQLKMQQNGHFMLDSIGEPVYFLSIATNETYYRITLSADVIAVPSGGSNPNSLVTGSTMQLVIPNNAFKTLLGFTNGSYPASPSVTNYAVNGSAIPVITNVSSILVSCNVANNDFNQFKDVIAVFTANKPYGSLLPIEPHNLIWYPVFNGTYSNISLRFYDQNYNPLQIIDKTSCTANLIFKSMEN
jgi:hypothetical protein